MLEGCWRWRIVLVVLLFVLSLMVARELGFFYFFELNLYETKNEKLEAYSQPTFTLRELYFEGQDWKIFG